MKKKYILINREPRIHNYYYPFMLLPAFSKDAGTYIFGYNEFTTVLEDGGQEDANKYLIKNDTIYVTSINEENKCIIFYLEDCKYLESNDAELVFIGYNLLLKKYEKRIEKEFNCKIPWEKIGTKK